MKAQKDPQKPSPKAINSQDEENIRTQLGTLQASADAGDVAAMSALGGAYVAYAHLLGAESKQKAAHWFCKAAESGDKSAMFTYGQLLQKGDGIAADHRESARWIEKSANAGYALAQMAMAGTIFSGVERGDLPASKHPQGVAYLNDAAAQRFPPAMYFLGHVCWHGKTGMRQDKEAGLAWLREAAKADEPRAQALLGQIYITQEGYDITEGVALLHTAANAGNHAALPLLVACYATGCGMPQPDLHEAKKLMQAAESHGQKVGRKIRQKILSALPDDPQKDDS